MTTPPDMPDEIYVYAVPYIGGFELHAKRYLERSGG